MEHQLRADDLIERLDLGYTLACHLLKSGLAPVVLILDLCLYIIVLGKVVIDRSV